MQAIELLSEPYYTFSVVLSGAPYTLTVEWSALEAAWYMDVKGAANDIDFKGLKLVGGVDLVSCYGSGPLGELRLYDLSGADADPTFDTLSTNFVLGYEEPA